MGLSLERVILQSEFRVMQSQIKYGRNPQYLANVLCATGAGVDQIGLLVMEASFPFKRDEE